MNMKEIEPKLLTLPARPKILLVRFSALGDVIQTLPILPLIRQRSPDAYLGWAIDAELVPAIEGHKLIDRIHACKRKKWSRDLGAPGRWPAVAREIRDFVKEVRDVKYDVVIDAQSLFKTGLLTWASGAKHKIGFAHGRECSRLFYDTAYINLRQYFDSSVHHVDHMALLTQVLGSGPTTPYSAPLPPVPPSTAAKISNALNQLFRNTNPIIAIAPGTQWPSKRWSDDEWVGLATMILERTAFNVVFVGSPADRQTVARILERLPATKRMADISGKTSIPELYALFPRVIAAIASDTAPLHIAAAAGTPYVFGIFGPTATTRTGPIGSPNTVLFSTEGQLSCQPCNKRVCPLGTGECLKRISAESVFAALVERVPRTVGANTLP
jgi:ADP-heptose:LPS heptosyltransferase